MKLTTQQIGKCGELLVQYYLLLNGVESAPMTTDSGIDLVAYSKLGNRAYTIQVKTNLKPKPGGGKGRLAIDWWVKEDSTTDLFAFVELETKGIWIIENKEIPKLSKQHPAKDFTYLWLLTRRLRKEKMVRL